MICTLKFCIIIWRRNECWIQFWQASRSGLRKAVYGEDSRWQTSGNKRRMWLRNRISIIRKAKKWGLEKKNIADRGYYAKNWKFKWKPKIMALPRIFKPERELELWINWWLDAAPWIFFWWWLWFELSYLQLARESKNKSNFLAK